MRVLRYVLFWIACLSVGSIVVFFLTQQVIFSFGIRSFIDSITTAQSSGVESCSEYLRDLTTNSEYTFSPVSTQYSVVFEDERQFLIQAECYPYAQNRQTVYEGELPPSLFAVLDSDSLVLGDEPSFLELVSFETLYKNLPQWTRFFQKHIFIVWDGSELSSSRDALTE
ncbi:MAG: hypothetical protein H6774_04475 [Pseudomonadales bacterium]|nr:hypothetical protein [Candidatus Woesebacteria bacterium]MCB9802314.1 hypothetical protein [Pseudomonadales bacterium]